MNIFILLNFFAIYCVFSSLLVSADQYYCSNKCECYLKGYNSNITEIFCSTKNNFKISLNIDTISELKYTAINISNITVLTVTCNNANDNYFENLASVAYKKIDQQMIEKLRILNCSLPDNKSFEEIFNKFQVENVTEIEYTIQEGNQERPFYIEYFEGMDKLNEISINFKKLSNSLSNIFHDSQGKDSAPLSNLDKYEMFNPIFENFYLNSTNDKMLIHLEMSQKIVVDIKCFNSKSQSNITIYATFPMTNSYPFIKIQLNNCKLPRKTNLLDILFSLYSKFENNQIYDVIIIDEKYIKQFLNEDFNNIAVIVKFSSRFNVISTFMELPILKIVNKTVSFEISIWKISGILLKDTSKYEYPGIKSLTIQRQFIKSSSKELFKDLHNIAELTLIENDISYLEHDFFEHLTNLIKLVISSNAFKKMSSEAFQNIPNLQVLESNNNRIMHNDIAIGFFKNMRYLKSIILTGHYAYGMSESIFYNFTSLTDISLNGNFHRNLNSNVFTRQRMMEKLNLNHNSIEILPDDIFKQNNKLKILRLSFNMFENISSKLFDGLVNLEELYLDNNAIHSINKLSQLSSVKIIDLQNNKLRPTDGSGLLRIFKQLKNLTHVVLKNNSLAITYIFFESSIEFIDLSFNKLMSCPVPLSGIDLNSKSLTIDLKYNFINLLGFMREINLIDVSVKRSVNLYVDNNELNCDCKAIDFIRLLTHKLMFESTIFEPIKFHLENMHCTNPPNMRSILVQDLKPIDLKCEFYCLYGYNCSCYYRTEDQTIVINCTSSRLKKIPNVNESLDFPELYLDYFFEKGQDYQNFIKVINFTSIEMILTNNNITHIDKIPENIRLLDIKANKITSLNNEILEQLKFFKTNVRLSDNPWQCNCSSKSFVHFLRQNPSFILDYENMSCDDNTKIIDLNTEELCFDFELIIIIFSAILLIILFATLAIYFKFQKLIKMWCFAHNICTCLISEDELDDDKIYDAFVVFAAPDQELVERLLIKLENEYNYKLCVHLRDWAPGELIVTQVFNSIRDSRRTIVILSPHFHASRWARFEFRVSLLQAFEENRSRVIIIINGELDEIDDMDEDLEAYLKLNTYININDRWFWEKIKFALPHNKREPISFKNKNSALQNIQKQENSENETIF